MKDQNNGLDGRLALVTGASAGIGMETARALSRAGARVVLCARRAERLQELAKELGNAEACPLDVRDAQAVQAALGEREFDIVVNNAGLAVGADKLPEGDPEGWSTMIDTNLKGVLHVLKATLPGLCKRQSGHHVFLGSVAGRQVYPGGNVYCATKWAVRAIYEAARVDSFGSGVKLTTVDPGAVETEFSNVRFADDEAKIRAVYAGFEPLHPEDVADAVLWALTRPAHVNIGEIVLWPAAQASTTLFDRRES